MFCFVGIFEERRSDEPVPGIGRRFALDLVQHAADDKYVGRARECHIEQPAILLRAQFKCRIARGTQAIRIFSFRNCPDECGRISNLENGITFGSWRENGFAVVSASTTIGASRPLTPWTVMTRIASLVVSRSRLISASVRRRNARNPCSDGVSERFVGKCGREKFIKRVGCFRPKPRHHPLSAAVAAEHARIKIERPQVQRFLAPLQKRPACCRVSRITRAIFRKILRERSGATMSERDQVVVVESEQRRFQHAASCRSSCFKQERVAERDQIHHGDMFGELESVRTGDRQAFLLQRTQNCFEQRAALLHQNNNVAGLRGTALFDFAIKGFDADR